MIDDSYFNTLRDELREIYDMYDDSYMYLSENVKKNVVRERYFSGSDEMLCIYEPSLTNRLRCNWCLKGSFKEKKPRSRAYHLISFDKDKVIKIDFFDDISSIYPNHNEIFFVYEPFKTMYLVFKKMNKNDIPILLEVYLLKYDEMSRLIEYVHIPSKALARDLTGEIYKYNKHNLIESITYSTWYSEIEKYEFEYNDDGYMSSYRHYDLNKSDPFIYTANFTLKDIELFEKRGRFYFSPINDP